MPIACQTVTVTQCVQSWVCEIPQTGYEIDGCGNRRPNWICGVPKGKKLKLTAACDAGILLYEWYLNSVKIGTTNEITIDTTPLPSDSNIIGLRAQNSCGWTDTIEKTIIILETTCTPEWVCEQPLSGYEIDGCGNRQPNPDCENPACPNPGCGIMMTQD